MPIESRGKKDPALAARLKAGVLPQDEAVEYEYVVGRRPLKVGDETRQPGEPIPEAAEWTRLESWLRSGAVIQRPPTAVHVAKPRPAAPAKKAAPPRVTKATPGHDDGEPKRSVLRPPRKGVSA